MKLKKTFKNYLKYYSKYLSQKFKFKKLGGKITHSFMILDDYKASAGIASGHYFHQDLLVASFIKKNNPNTENVQFIQELIIIEIKQK